jgi:hypothetical protein
MCGLVVVLISLEQSWDPSGVAAHWIFLYAHASHGPKISCKCMGAAGVDYDRCELALDLVDVGWPAYLSAICRQWHRLISLLFCARLAKPNRTMDCDAVCLLVFVLFYKSYPYIFQGHEMCCHIHCICSATAWVICRPGHCRPGQNGWSPSYRCADQQKPL